MRKRTVKHFLIYLYRSVFLLLPLLAGLVFSAIKLPLNSPSWDYGEEFTEENNNTLSERFNVFFASTVYEPMKQLGLQSTFVYDGTSRLFGLLGFSVPPTSPSIQYEDIVVGHKYNSFRLKTDVDPGEIIPGLADVFKQSLDPLATTTSNYDILLFDNPFSYPTL